MNLQTTFSVFVIMVHYRKGGMDSVLAVQYFSSLVNIYSAHIIKPVREYLQ
jgi:hypothetical protein